MTLLNRNLKEISKGFFPDYPLSDQDRESLLSEQVKILRSNIQSGLIGQLLVSLIFLFYVYTSLEKYYLLVWLGAFLFSLLARFILYIRIYKNYDDYPADIWLKWLTFTVALIGAVWGSIICFHILDPSSLHEVFIGVMVAGLSTIGVFNGISHWRTILAFIIPAMLPFIVFQLLQGEAYNYTLGLIASLYAIYIIYCGFRMNRLMLERLKLELDNKKLLMNIAETERHKANKDADKRLRYLLDQLGSGVLMVDDKFNHIFWNKTYEEIFNFPAGFLKTGLGLEKALRWYYEDAGYCDEDVERITGSFFTDLSKESPNGKIIQKIDLADGRIIEISAELGTDRIILFNFVDVTKREKTNAEALFHMGQRDSLTGLPNRFLLKSHLKKILGKSKVEGQPFALILLNVDNFQFINETYGLSTGDLMINNIARKLEAEVSENEFLSHLGGDSFAIIGKYSSNRQDVLDRVSQILKLFNKPSSFIREGEEVDVLISLSAGISYYEKEGCSVDDMLLNAAIALSIAKKKTPGHITVYEPTMHAEIKSRNILVTNIRDSLATSQFILHYQPQINVKTRKISGVEALLRWNHPEREWISPAEFIPLAELSKQIIPLTEQFLPVACRQAKDWHNHGMDPVPVSVNISPLHFLSEGFVPMVKKCLSDARLDPKWLELEITEGIIMNNSEATIAKLNELADMGVQLAIDDFGTGYSSLTYLRALPVNKLKIDQAFISDMVKEGDARAVVEAIIRLGHSFNLKIIAEGIESEEELSLLANMRCDYAQGYFISRPMIAENIYDWIREYSP